MRPRARSRAAALLAGMATVAGLLGLGEMAGAALGSAPTAPGVTVAAAATGPAVNPPAVIPATVRLSGADRYATAAAVSAASFPTGAAVAYLATGSDYPDALTAAAAAGGRGPVLLGTAGGLPVATIAELQRLRPSQVVIVGGTAGMPTTTEAAVRSTLPRASVSRIAGNDRYSTAAAVASATFHAPVASVWVATGQAFPDALSAAAAAGGRGPVVLVPPQGIPLATTFALGNLQPRQVYIVGGTSAIATATEATLARVLPHSTVTRVAGADRYATAAAVSAAAFAGGAPTVFLATGQSFPDALTAAAAAGGRGPVLLVGAAAAPGPVMSELQRLRPARLNVVGGLNVLANSLIQQINAAFAGPAPTTTLPTTTLAPTTSPTAKGATTSTTTSTTAKGATTSTTTSTTAKPPTSTTWPLPTTSTTIPGITTTLPASPPPPPAPSASLAVTTAEAQLGKPYLWAGAGPDNFDCSGLTMFAWAAAGVILPHNAAAQQEMLPAVAADQADLAPGDLLFYDSPVDHVAMYVGSGMMVEAAHSGVPVRLVPMRTDNLVGAARP